MPSISAIITCRNHSNNKNNNNSTSLTSILHSRMGRSEPVRPAQNLSIDPSPFPKLKSHRRPIQRKEAAAVEAVEVEAEEVP